MVTWKRSIEKIFRLWKYNPFLVGYWDMRRKLNGKSVYEHSPIRGHVFCRASSYVAKLDSESKIFGLFVICYMYVRDAYMRSVIGIGVSSSQAPHRKTTSETAHCSKADDDGQNDHRIRPMIGKRE